VAGGLLKNSFQKEVAGTRTGTSLLILQPKLKLAACERFRLLSGN